MSTKIFNGYRLKAESLADLFEFAETFRQKSKEYLNTHYKQLLAVKMAAFIDAVALDKMERFQDKNLMLDLPYLYAVRSWLDGKIVEAERSDLSSEASYDLSAHLQFYLVGDMVLFQIFGHNDGYEKLLDDFDDVESFPYWNNTDPPDDMTEEAWKERGEIWDAAIKGGIPANTGLSITCKAQTTTPSGLKGAELLTLIPNVRERAGGWAKNSLFKDFYEQNKDAYEDRPTRAIFDYQEWLGTDVGKQDMKAEVERIAALLPNINDELLSTHILQDIKDKGRTLPEEVS